jgi:hypothetical protein
MANTLREGVRDIAHQVHPRELDAKVEEAVQNQPLLPHLLSMRVVFTAAAIGAGVALVLYVLFSPMLAGIGLILAFFGAWFALAVRSHEREPKAARRARLDEDDEADEDAPGR